MLPSEASLLLRNNATKSINVAVGGRFSVAIHNVSPRLTVYVHHFASALSLAALPLAALAVRPRRALRRRGTHLVQATGSTGAAIIRAGGSSRNCRATRPDAQLSRQQVEERLADRRLRRDPQEGLAVRTAFNADARAGQRSRISQIVLAVKRRIGDSRGEGVELLFSRRGELDLGRQRLSERRIDRQFAKAEGRARARQQSAVANKLNVRMGFVDTDPFRISDSSTKHNIMG
jgi:hypothetical protein